IDSAKKAAVVQRKQKAELIKQNVVPVVFSNEHADSLLQRIDRLHTILNNITNQSKFGFKTEEIEKEIKGIESGVDVISASLSRDSTVLNIDNLQMFRGLLKDMADKLHG